MLLVVVQMVVDAAGSVAMAGPEELEAGMEKRVEGLVTTGGWGRKLRNKSQGERRPVRQAYDLNVLLPSVHLDDDVDWAAVIPSWRIDDLWIVRARSGNSMASPMRPTVDGTVSHKTV